MEENEVYLAAQEILEGNLDFLFPNLDGEYVLTDEDEVLRKDMMIDEDIFMEDNEDKTLQKDERNYLRSQEKKIEDSKKFLKDHQSQEKNIEENENFLKNLKSQEKIEVDDMFLMDLKSQEKKIELDDMFLMDLKSQERKIEEVKNFPQNHKSQEKKIEIDDTTQKNLKRQKKAIKENEVMKIKSLDEDIKKRVESNEDEDIKKRVEGDEDEDIKKRVEDNEVKEQESGEQLKLNLKVSDVDLGTSDMIFHQNDMQQYVQGEKLPELPKEVAEILESSELVEDETEKVSETIKVFEYAKEHESGENLQPAKNKDCLDELDEEDLRVRIFEDSSMKKREAPTNNIHFNSHEEEEAKEDLIPGIEGFIVDNVDETECSDSESNYSPISPFLSLPPSQDFKSMFVQDEPDFSPGNESEFEETPTLCLTPEPSPNFNFVKTQGLMMRALTPDSSSDCSPSYSTRKRKRSAATKQPYSEQSEPKQTKLSSEQIPETWIENKKPIFQHREKATFNEDAENELRIVPDRNTSTGINVGVKKKLNPIIRNMSTMSPEFGVVPTISELGLGFEKGELQEMNDRHMYPEESFYSDEEKSGLVLKQRDTECQDLSRDDNDEDEDGFGDLDEDEEKFKNQNMIPLTFDCSRDLMRKLVQDITADGIKEGQSKYKDKFYPTGRSKNSYNQPAKVEDECYQLQRSHNHLERKKEKFNQTGRIEDSLYQPDRSENNSCQPGRSKHDLQDRISMKTDSNGLSKILLEAEILESEFEINAQRSHPPRLDKSSNVFNDVSHANEDTGNHNLGYAGNHNLGYAGNHNLGYAGNHNIKDTGNHGVEGTGNNAGNHDIEVAGNQIVQEAPVSSASLETSGVDSKSEELLVLSSGSSGVQISGETCLGSTKTAKTKLDELEQFMKETLASESTKIFENTPHIEGKNCLEIPKTLNRDKDDMGRIYPIRSQIEQNPSVQTPELYPSQEYVKNQEKIVERNLIVNPMQLLNRPPRVGLSRNQGGLNSLHLERR